MFNLLSRSSPLHRESGAVVRASAIARVMAAALATVPVMLPGTLALAVGIYSATTHADTTNSRAAKNEKNLADKLAKQHLVQGEVVDSINNYTLDGWNYVDDNHIVINTGPSKRYLITLMSSCHDLSSVDNIAFTTTVNRLTKFDKLMVRGISGMVQHCPITQINELTKTKKAS